MILFYAYLIFDLICWGGNEMQNKHSVVVQIHLKKFKEKNLEWGVDLAVEK